MSAHVPIPTLTRQASYQACDDSVIAAPKCAKGTFQAEISQEPSRFTSEDFSDGSVHSCISGDPEYYPRALDQKYVVRVNPPEEVLPTPNAVFKEFVEQAMTDYLSICSETGRKPKVDAEQTIKDYLEDLVEQKAQTIDQEGAVRLLKRLLD